MARPKLDPKSILARFMFDSNKIRPTGKLHYKAFWPDFDEKAGCQATSTFCIQGLLNEEINSITENVAKDRGKPPKARGDMCVQIYRDYALEDDFDDDPKHHVNIIGWPDNKELWRSIAQKLEAACSEKGTVCNLTV